MKIKAKIYLALLLLSMTLSVSAQQPEIKYVESFDNIHHPQILYWFWGDDTIENQQYRKDIDKIAEKSPFGLIFISARGKAIDLADTERMRPYLEDAANYAHSKGLKLGLQVYARRIDRGTNKENAAAMIAKGECLLDAQGKGTILNAAVSSRLNQTFDAELVKVWLFRKTAEGVYDAASLVEAQSEWLNATLTDTFSVKIAVAAPPQYAGYSAYAVTEHYFDGFNILSPEMRNYFTDILDAYAHIPFDGAALDENGSMWVDFKKFNATKTYMSEYPWGIQLAKDLQRACGYDPVRLLLDMQYAPENNPQRRIKAINTYFETWTKEPLTVENIFHDRAKKLYGKNCFIGFHTTFHNALTGDDVWATGLNWWDLPREYGQSDEHLPMPDQLGISLSGYGNKPVYYNMFYDKNKEVILNEAANKLAFGVRMHYHAWNDLVWGKDLADDDFLQDVAPVEDRTCLLNHFDPAPPKLSVLVIYNFPYLLNWYPNANEQNYMGIRGTDMQQVAASIWDAGYPCAAVPDRWIEKGLLKIRSDGKVQIKDRIFEAVVFLYPQYAKQSSFKFMKKLLDKKVKLMIKGQATADFDGKDCAAVFTSLMERATPFDIKSIPSVWGIKPNPVKNGIFLQDGSVVMSDYASIKNKTNTTFSVQIGEDVFTGSYQGAFALKVDKVGNIEKMACGNFSSLQKNGKTILDLPSPADVLVETHKGKQTIQIKK